MIFLSNCFAAFIAHTSLVQFISDFQVCFQNKAELQVAVDVYIVQNCGATNATSNECTSDRSLLACQIVETSYGWPIGRWCVSKVTDMSYLFQFKTTFNEDLSGWDTSSVEDMRGMFYGASSFDSNLSSWNTSKVKTMKSMFSEASEFSSDLSKWDVSSVEDMTFMLYGASSFDSDLSSWNISSVASMEYMLYGATSFNQDLCAWGEKFPYNNAFVIFEGSGCTFQDNPQESQQGPFCASSCN